MQKLMVMRLCNTSEYRHSMNYSQELVCLTQTGDNRSDFEHSWSWHPTVPHGVSSMFTSRTLNGQLGWNVAQPEHALPVLECGWNRKVWGGHSAKGQGKRGRGQGLVISK